MEMTKQQSNLNSLRRTRHVARHLTSNCRRCQGLLIESFCISPKEDNADFQIPVRKCLQCGDLFDFTILENRYRSQHHQPTQQNGGGTL